MSNYLDRVWSGELRINQNSDQFDFLAEHQGDVRIKWINYGWDSTDVAIVGSRHHVHDYFREEVLYFNPTVNPREWRYDQLVLWNITAEPERGYRNSLYIVKVDLIRVPTDLGFRPSPGSQLCTRCWFIGRDGDLERANRNPGDSGQVRSGDGTFGTSPFQPVPSVLPQLPPSVRALHERFDHSELTSYQRSSRFSGTHTTEEFIYQGPPFALPEPVPEREHYESESLLFRRNNFIRPNFNPELNPSDARSAFEASTTREPESDESEIGEDES